MFTKDEIKARARELNDAAVASGEDPEEAGLNIAMLIVGADFHGKKQRSGEDFSEHALTVASYHHSKYKRIISLLHDVVEDTEWELQDLRDMGFSERVIKGVDAVTQKENEPYFDFIERCSTAGEDAIEVKIADLKHNMDPSRYRHIVDTERQILKAKAYNVAHHYLVDIQKTRPERLQSGAALTDEFNPGY